MKNKLIFLLIFISTISWGQSKIFFVNLYYSDLDVRLGDENNYIFKMINLSSYNATYLLPTTRPGNYNLYFKLSTSDTWIAWGNEKGEKYNCLVEENKSHCILAGTDGNMQFFTMDEEKNTGPKICFINGSDSKLNRMEISETWKKNVAYAFEGLEKNLISNFLAFNEGEYSIYWQFPGGQERSNSYFYIPDESGNSPLIFEFRNENYYIFMAFTESREDYGRLITITPQS